MDLLKDKVAVVSGAARGQGRSHAIRLAEEGADIVALDLCSDIASVPYPLATGADLAETTARIERLGRRVVAIEADVRDHASVTAAVDRGVQELGRLDIVVANAGIVSYAVVSEVSVDMWQDMIATNLTGVWNLCQASTRHLVDGGRGGAMVLTSSSAAHVGVAHLAHYSAAKAGVVGLMQSLAVELAPHRIRVNTVHPTAVNTPMLQNEVTYRLFAPGLTAAVDPVSPPEEVAGPLRSLNSLPVPWIEASDVSEAVLYLASDRGRYVTGTQLRVDAGSAVR
ncbi:mycofactocin-coupled SDR family oxidoreductase [Amycolatopsis echigonensis]|uniref:mycofactocin-coupled SDR family oxidoreductase n=1 Tax=Amycolatopsis echigonensis TaxID=2576905 RepID=UPI0028B13BC8|nr:mycofactocin-coupled SDR family oxidoreductase [Amycolatopsis echigonensis]